MVQLELGEVEGDALKALLREQVLQRRAFVPGARAAGTLTPCVLVVPLPSGDLRLAGEVVFACQEGPGSGVGVQLEPLPEAARAAIEAFLNAPAAPEPAVAGSPAADSEEEARRPGEPDPRALQVRLRNLTGPEQRKVALTGNLSERVLLERLYGPNVWEPLLSSGRLSLPEVATIARKGTVPKPLLDLIGANAAWLGADLVQRALLANPRTSHPLAKKILSMLPKHELERVPKMTAYPASVRQAAVVLLKGRSA